MQKNYKKTTKQVHNNHTETYTKKDYKDLKISTNIFKIITTILKIITIVLRLLKSLCHSPL